MLALQWALALMVACGWTYKLIEAAIGMPKVPDITRDEFNARLMLEAFKIVKLPAGCSLEDSVTGGKMVLRTPGDSLTVKFLAHYILNDAGKVWRLKTMTWPAEKGVSKLPPLTRRRGKRFTSMRR